MVDVYEDQHLIKMLFELDVSKEKKKINKKNKIHF
jgi:hypothetical protein